jgi:hypothetical protein
MILRNPATRQAYATTASAGSSLISIPPNYPIPKRQSADHGATCHFFYPEPERYPLRLVDATVWLWYRMLLTREPVSAHCEHGGGLRKEVEENCSTNGQCFWTVLDRLKQPCWGCPKLFAGVLNNGTSTVSLVETRKYVY